MAKTNVFMVTIKSGHHKNLKLATKKLKKNQFRDKKKVFIANNKDPYSEKKFPRIYFSINFFTFLLQGDEIFTSRFNLQQKFLKVNATFFCYEDPHASNENVFSPLS